jgi:hypothetical protein
MPWAHGFGRSLSAIRRLLGDDAPVRASRFPAGKHDDQVDALGLIGQLLDIIQPGQHPPKPEVKAPDSGYRPAGELADKPLDWMLF